MRAIILTALLATAFSAAFAATPANTPAPSALCPIQHSAVNASCPMIKSNGQDMSSCLPGLTGGSETSPSSPSAQRERRGRNA